METLKEYHYVYYSYEEWGRGYFGSRTCKCLPKEDIDYFGLDSSGMYRVARGKQKTYKGWIVTL